MANSEAFERNSAFVADVVDSIPKGHCTTYGAIGQAVGITPRYVASIMSRSEEIHATPWFRVVGSDATVKAGPQRTEQIRRLKAEGFTFSDHRIDDFAQRFVQPSR